VQALAGAAGAAAVAEIADHLAGREGVALARGNLMPFGNPMPFKDYQANAPEHATARRVQLV